jgi:zinc transport system ATP-binding protein
MTAPAIRFQDVTFAYNGAPVLEGVDLTVPAGDFLAMLGPNGGGKTTLIKLVLGLLSPDTGEIEVFGRPAGGSPGLTGYMPQHTHYNLDFPIRVLDVALQGLVHASRRGWRFSSQEKARAREVLDMVGMADHADASLKELSGGQRQRVFIARALACRPRLLLLDEPTANVDPHGRYCLFELLARLSPEVTIVVVSHDLSIVSSQLTSTACVNHQVLYNPQPEITREQSELMYGRHDHSCPSFALARLETGEHTGPV